MRWNFLLIIGAIGLSVALLEGGLEAIRLGDDAPFALDDRLIYRPVGGARFAYVQMHENGGEVVWTEFGELGHRVTQITEDNAPDTNVVVYGDSFIQGSFVAADETFVAFLEDGLSAAVSIPVSVTNAGVDGYGPDQIYLRLLRDIEKFDHDVVIISIFADNDLGDLIRNRLAYLEPDGALSFNQPKFGDELRDSYEFKSTISAMPAALRVFYAPGLVRREVKVLLDRNLNLGVTLSDTARTDISSAYRTDPEIDWIAIWKSQGEMEYQDYVLAKNSALNLDNVRSDHYDVVVSTAPTSKSARQRIALFENIVSRIRELQKEHSIHILFMIIPSPIDVCQNYDWQVDLAEFPEYRRRNIIEAIGNAIAQEDIPMVTLFDFFEQQPNCESLYYHHGNNHWTPRAQKLAADLITSHLIDSGVVEIAREFSTGSSAAGSITSLARPPSH
jgi:hypothetical protein